jgi:hypothetical protein
MIQLEEGIVGLYGVRGGSGRASALLGRCSSRPRSLLISRYPSSAGSCAPWSCRTTIVFARSADSHVLRYRGVVAEQLLHGFRDLARRAQAVQPRRGRQPISLVQDNEGGELGGDMVDELGRQPQHCRHAGGGPGAGRSRWVDHGRDRTEGDRQNLVMWPVITNSPVVTAPSQPGASRPRGRRPGLCRTHSVAARPDARIVEPKDRRHHRDLSLTTAACRAWEVHHDAGGGRADGST